MSVESAKEFLKKLQEDAEFKKAIEEAKEDTAKVKKIVEDAGFSFTKQELEEAMGVTGSQELSEEDLEKVAGGSFWRIHEKIWEIVSGTWLIDKMPDP